MPSIVQRCWVCDVGPWTLRELLLRCRRRRSCQRHPARTRRRPCAPPTAGQLRPLRAPVLLGGAAGAPLLPPCFPRCECMCLCSLSFSVRLSVTVLACSQAAATGETVMDEHLSRLAAEDPTRLLRLNQRMQVVGRGAQAQPSSSRATSPGNGPYVSTSQGAAASALQGRTCACLASYCIKSQEP